MASLKNSSLMMANKYQKLFVAYLVVVVGGLLAFCVDSAFGQEHQSREERGSKKFMEGPNGDPCVLNPEGGGDNTYVHIFESGTELSCDLCPIGKVLVSNCTSTRETECRILRPDEEQLMPYPNFCNCGFPCKTCPVPSQTVKKLCDPIRVEDTECKCADDYYSVNFEADMCRPLPRCSRGFEPRPGAGADGVADMKCQPCGIGFYQLNDNSTDLCRKHTNCITTPGTDVSDNICKGDPQSSGSPATSSNVPSVQPTRPSTQVSTGPTSPMPAEITDPPNETEPTPTLAEITNPPDETGANYKTWYVALAIVTHVFCFVFGIVFKTILDRWKKKKDYKKAPTQEPNMELNTIEESTNGSMAVNMPSSDEGEPNVVTDLKTKKGRKYLRRQIKQRGGKR